MSIVEIIETYASADGEHRPVLLLPGTRHLLDQVTGAVTHEPGEPTPDLGALLVGAAKPGKEGAEVEAVAAGVGERDVLLLLLGSVPSALRVGPLVQSFTAAGLRVVRAEQLEAPLAGTLVVACRGETLPLRSYLLAETIPDTESAQLRLVNEWAVEGLQLRTLAASLTPTRKAAEQQIRAAEQRIRAAEQQVRAAQQGNAEARSELAALQAELATCANDNIALRRQLERGARWKLRRATQIVREDPVGGTKRLARAVTRRTKR